MGLENSPIKHFTKTYENRYPDLVGYYDGTIGIHCCQSLLSMKIISHCSVQYTGGANVFRIWVNKPRRENVIKVNTVVRVAMRFK